MKTVHEVPETIASCERQLSNGKTLEYRLQILQQPERARACGMGAKSQADRRPIDPPPVIELRLFEGSGSDRTDVTFSCTSTFVVYSTLEHARPLAQVRGMPTSSPKPVLTGVSIAGIAYLDRPAPAGYFVFPDLSVRHEGLYRLRFSLFENTKENAYPRPHGNWKGQEEFTHRLDVKTREFFAFSAKKFPGLTESTALSRIIAEQGCRIRIRRDVRMRRRNDELPRREEIVDETALFRAQQKYKAGNPIDEHKHSKNVQRQPVLDSQPQHQQQSAPPSMQPSRSNQRERTYSDASMSSESGGYQLRSSSGLAATPSSSHSSVFPKPMQLSASQLPSSSPIVPYRPASHFVPPVVTSYSDHAPSPQNLHDQSRRSSSAQYSKPSASSENSLQQHSDFCTPRSQEGSCQGIQQQHYRPTTPGPSTSEYPQASTSQQPQQQSGQRSYHQQSRGPDHFLPPLRLPPIDTTLWGSRPTAPTMPGPHLTMEPSNTPITPNHPTMPAAANWEPWRTPSASRVPASFSITGSIPAPPPEMFPPYYPDQVHGIPPPITSQPPSRENIQPPKKRAWGGVFNPEQVTAPLNNMSRPRTDDEIYGCEPDTGISADPSNDSEDFSCVKMLYRRADGAEIVRAIPRNDERG